MQNSRRQKPGGRGQKEQITYEIQTPPDLEPRSQEFSRGLKPKFATVTQLMAEDSIPFASSIAALCLS